ncbi:lectin [Actinocrinis puniceicyclus]|uniref:Lectin n=1 Tax=Actinocrinis puniceicyclus TaxID=977794 RepID=A0A8J7WNF1_9ACTN|nr:lectin [Actinocrinis puniceicyclus]MBS2962655.1 lectin [Actinocrinis puniceicyclus]
MTTPARRASSLPRRVAVTALATALATAPALSGGAGAAARAAAPAAPAVLVSDPSSLVNPFIGTTGDGHDFPGADVPYGMLQWSPDTSSRPKGGGYDYGDSAITGFSLTHISGPGCDAAGDVPVLPTVGAVDSSPGSDSTSFSHSGEDASPGYYGVTLGNGVRTELTTTARAGLGRFTFPATTQANLILKVAAGQTPTGATSVSVLSGTELAGSVTSDGFCEATNPFTLYFAISFDRAFTASGAYGSTASGPAGEYVTFDTTANRTVLARVGISYTSIAEARANRDAEIPVTAGFAAVQASARAAWTAQLGRIRIAGGTADQQTVFYTALYHASLHPNVFSDADGSYLGFDNRVHTVPAGRAHYANYSGWDIYRSQAQLTALIDPGVASDMAQSMVDDYEQGGTLPKWAMDNGETYIMVGDPGAIVLADYYAFGARDFDTAAALSAMVRQATTPNDDRPGVGYLDTFGYLPTDSVYGCCHEYATVSTQLEYDSADFAVSAFAGALGDSAEQTRLRNRAQDWRNIFNPSSGYIQPRHSNGRWMDGFLAAPISGGTNTNDFAEGDSLIYTGMIPFNLAGLAAAEGGNTAMAGYLDHVLSGYSGLLSLAGFQANMGNEPSFELPWEYDYIAQPYKTQRDVRQIQDQLWTDSPGALAGNDDLGEMSSWYVWSALGMYPETPGTADLALGSALFAQAVVNPGAANQITINAPSAADGSPYVQGLTYNGAAWNNAYLPENVVAAGATLTYSLGSSANTSWATASTSAPPSYDGTATSFAKEPVGPVRSGIAGKCVDDAGSGTSNGTHIQLYTCNGAGAQNWTVVPDNTLQVFNKCMDVVGGATAPGTKVQLYTCNGTMAQQWTANSAGQLVNTGSGLCLYASTTNDTDQLQIYTCTPGAADETWTLP